MQVQRARLSRKALQSLPPEQRRLFFALAHLMNEVTALSRLSYWSRTRSTYEATQHCETAAMFFYLRLLAAKVWEGWQVLQGSFFPHKDFSRLFHAKATDRGRLALENLKAAFSGKGSGTQMDDIRNNFAFHYEPERLDEVLGWVPDELDLYVEDRGVFNTCYYFAEVLVNQAMLKIFGGPEEHGASRQFSDTVHALAGDFLGFGQAVLLLIASEHGSLWEGPRVPVDTGEAPKFSEVHVPWFADASDDMDAVDEARKQGDESDPAFGPP